MAHEYRPGDVVRYDPAEHHCREGMAIAYERHGNVVLLDTFWDGYGDRHMLTADERDTAQLSFNLNDYDELDQYNRSSPGNWGKYAPDDRRTITSQHGLRKRWFIRQGATEHWPTQIDNARKEVATRESDVGLTPIG